MWRRKVEKIGTGRDLHRIVDELEKVCERMSLKVNVDESIVSVACKGQRPGTGNEKMGKGE